MTGTVGGVTLAARDVDAVVFDMDGVVTDTAGVHFVAWKSMFDAFLAEVTRRTGRPQRPFDDEDYRRFVDGRQRDDGVSAFLGSRGIDLPRGTADDPPERESCWGLANRKNRAFKQALSTEGARAFPSSVALVRDLHAHGIGTAIVSASRNCQAILESAGIGELFAVRVDGLEAARLDLPGKPAPAMYLEAARRLGADPARSVVVEDALAGVRAGRDGGFGLVIGVDRVGHGGELAAEGAHVVVTDLAQVHVTA